MTLVYMYLPILLLCVALMRGREQKLQSVMVHILTLSIQEDTTPLEI